MATHTITTYSSTPDAFLVNSHIIGTRDGLIVVDTQFVLPEADKLVARLAGFGLPVLAVVLTHPHPDHVNGTARLLDRWPAARVIATEKTRAGIAELAGPKRAQWKPILGDAYPDSVVGPTEIVPDGGTTRAGSLEMLFWDVGPMESLNESVIAVPELGVAFVGDLFYNRVHPWLVEGRTAAWLDRLGESQAQLDGYGTLYCGHGTSASPRALTEQAEYIRWFRDLVRQHLAGSSELSPDARQAIRAATAERFPGWPLDGLIDMNATGVCNELTAPHD